MPTRVLYVDNTYTFGGAINSLSHLVSAFDGSEVQAVVSSGQDPVVLDALFPGATRESRSIHSPWRRGKLYRRLRATRGLGSGGGRRLLDLAHGGWRLGTRYLPSALALARAGTRHRVDLIHTNNAIESQPDAIVAAGLLGLPAVAHARGAQSGSRSARLYASGAAMHIAISTYIAANLRDMGISEERIALIPDGIDLETFHPAPSRPELARELGVPEGARVFGIFGRVIPWKGVLEFVEAAILVLGEVPDAVALVVGDPSDGGEWYYRSVKERAADSPVADRILFTGYRSDVPDVMRLCDVVVHTSIDPEPFGMVLAEAMACGLPVVAADRGGPRDIVTGGTGFLADPEHPVMVAEHVRRLLEDRELRGMMGERALRRARREYSSRRYAERVLEVYDSVLAGSAKHRARR